MKPFDLERAKKGVPMRTRDDRKAIFVAVLSGGQPAPLLAEIWDNHDDEDDEFDDEGELRTQPLEEPVGVLENYYIDGRHGTVHDSELDLFMEY
jgi:hypothetical protein